MGSENRAGDAAISLEAERFRLMANSISDFAIFMLDPAGTIVSWNVGAERINQSAADEIIGRHFSIFYSDEDRGARKPELELEVAAREGRVEEEGWRLRKDGTRFWAHVVITALRSEGGAVCGFANVTRDLTERRRSDERLRQSEQGLRLLIDSIRDYAIFRLDVHGRIASWNAGAQRFKQYKTEEIVGQHFSIFYPEEQVRAGQCELGLTVAASEGRFEEEAWRVRKDGTRFWANVIISALRDDSGALIGFAKVTRDLTDRRQAEEERLGRARAEEAVRMRDEFLSIASHELKTPLTSLQLRIGSIQRLLQGNKLAQTLPENLIQRIDSVESELDRITQLVDSLLDVSRASSGELRLELTEVDVGAIVRDVVARFEGNLLAARCPVQLCLDEGLTAVLDRQRLDQVVANLLANAVKYGRGKPIELGAFRREGAIVIEVRDQGIGIAVQDQVRIFDRFARAVPESHYGGLGLGLWIARTIVEAMGGTIDVKSRPGEGALFTVAIPSGTGAKSP